MDHCAFCVAFSIFEMGFQNKQEFKLVTVSMLKIVCLGRNFRMVCSATTKSLP